jgi:hypothetical protein
MNPAAITAQPVDVFRRPAVRDTAALLALAWAVPFLVHLIPWAGARPLGVYLLPMFWTAFVATYFYGAVIGIVVGMFAPLINLAVTGLPASKYAFESMLELTVFAVAAAWLVCRAPRLIVIAPLSYIVARIAWAEWQGLTDPAVQFADVATAGRTVLRSLINGSSGLAVLMALNVALVLFYPKTPAPKPNA